jgi:RNA polymerase sigma factor (sigma-70 family)
VVTVAGNEVLRYVERRDRRARRETALGEDEPADVAIAVRLAGVERRTDLVVAVRRLSAQDRTIVALHYFRDVPLPAIAHELDMRLGTVKARLLRARVRLRQELEP